MNYLTATTVQQLADRLDVPEKKLRSWLRADEYCKRFAPGSGGEWPINQEMCRRMGEKAGR